MSYWDEQKLVPGQGKWINGHWFPPDCDRCERCGIPHAEFMRDWKYCPVMSLSEQEERAGKP